MRYDFDEILDRRATHALKWTSVPDGTIPMTIADMDFRMLSEVTDAIRTAADRGDFGYVGMMDEDYAAVIDWCAARHDEIIPREHLISTPGVLYTMHAAMYALTRPGDRVIVQPPLHTPSIVSAGLLGRVPVRNELILRPDGTYTFDPEGLDACFASGARVLMMCSPNNPTGRVWTRKELESVTEIVRQYDGYVVSDEIHRDIVWPGHEHIPIASLPGMEDRTVTVFSTSKTFNMGGFHIGSAVIANAELRNAVVRELYAFGHACGRPTALCIAAQTAAYRYGTQWGDEMLAYVDGNIRLVLDSLTGLPVRTYHPDGTFLLWVNISEMGFDTDSLADFSRRVRVAFDPGHYYETADYRSYRGPENFLRLNVSMPRALVAEAMERIRRGIEAQ